MTPLEQYQDTLNTLRILNKEPRHFYTAEHVPMKNRAPMFGLTTVDNNSWLVGKRAEKDPVLSDPHNLYSQDP